MYNKRTYIYSTRHIQYTRGYVPQTQQNVMIFSTRLLSKQFSNKDAKSMALPVAKAMEQGEQLYGNTSLSLCDNLWFKGGPKFNGIHSIFSQAAHTQTHTFFSYFIFL